MPKFYLGEYYIFIILILIEVLDNLKQLEENKI